MNKTQILKVKGTWNEVLNDCRATVKKLPLSKEPSDKFIKSILLSEHSPIRDIVIKWTWPEIPYWVAMHWKTHHWESRVDSQRNDRQNRYDRTKAPQDSPVNFYGDANIQNLIDTWRKRLCFQASKETREYAEDFKRVLMEDQDLSQIGDVLQKNCIYRCGCSEINGCGWFKQFVENHPDLDLTDIQKRYDAANADFISNKK